MRHLLGNPYIRIKTPRTVDGLNLLYDEKGQISYRIMEMPMSAKKHIERENATLPRQLQQIIEVIDEDAKPVLPENRFQAEEPDDPKNEIPEEVEPKKPIKNKAK
jgi:hypothetical protein